MSFDLNNSAASVPAEIGRTAATNQVLRNTYTLLAVSMVPTVLGAAIGMYSGLARALLGSPIVSLVVFFAGAFGLMHMVERNKERTSGVIWLMVFTFFMGLMLSRIIDVTLSRYVNGGQLIMFAFGSTAIIFAAMAGIASTIKRDLSGFGKFLMIGAIVLMLASIGNVFFKIPALSLTIMCVAVVLFSLFLIYDLNQIMTGGETNYISATLSVYLNIYNIFQSLLAIFGIFGGDRD